MSMCSIDQKRLQYECMNSSRQSSNFGRLPEFEKELSKLSKKYRSLEADLERLEKVLLLNPTGVGANFVLLHNAKHIKIVKTRLACASLKDRSIRVIYAYHTALDSRESDGELQTVATFLYIEIYFKGQKQNEDRDRIEGYLRENRG